MTLPVVWLPEAAAEPQDAVLRYASIRAELAWRFGAAVVDTVERISEGPLHYALLDRKRRRAGVSRFPYSLVFLLEETQIVVIACFHGRRNPKSWQSR